MASGKSAISLIYTELLRLKRFFPPTRQNFWKDKEVLQEEKVTTLILKKSISSNINRDISMNCLLSFFQFAAGFT